MGRKSGAELKSRWVEVITCSCRLAFLGHLHDLDTAVATGPNKPSKRHSQRPDCPSFCHAQFVLHSSVAERHLSMTICTISITTRCHHIRHHSSHSWNRR